MSCHYFQPLTWRHKTLRNIFLAELVVWSGESAECWIPYGKRKQLVRSENIWTPLRNQRGGFLCSLSCRWSTGSKGEAFSTAGWMGQHTNTETESGNSLSTYFSVENKHKPCRRWNETLLATCSEPTVLEFLSRKRDLQEQCMWVWNLCSPRSQNASHVDKCHC